jgi:alpha-amylase
MRKHLLIKIMMLTLLVVLLNNNWRQISSVFSKTTAPLPRTAFVQLFEWKWDDVAQECETFLGPKGFAAVQVSPAIEHVVVPNARFPWWQRYQPVSYKIVSRSGDRAQFAQMVDRCHAAGVQVYADAVINHMAGEQSGVGIAGSPFTKYDYPRLYQPKDFHTCRYNITNYRNHTEVTNCELVGLADLDTGSNKVRHRLADYLSDLVSLGVDGFRIDAAKHMDAGDLKAILQILNAKVEPDPYIYQEVIDPGNEAVKKSEYYSNGDVSEFEYGKKVGAKFLGIAGQTLSQLETLGESWGLMPSDRATIFIDNHDTQRGHAGGGLYITYKNGKLYDLANIFMLAFPYGYPLIMSSYDFSDSEQGPPSDANGHTYSVYTNGKANCFGEWKCEHRRSPIANMVGFRNYTTSNQMTDWWSNDGNQIAFGRGDRGFVVINRESTPLNRTFQTGLPEGVYCDVISGDRTADGRDCTGLQVTVSQDGQVNLTVAEMSAVALHGGAKIEAGRSR